MRIGIVNDMALAVEMMRKVLEHSGKHSILWVAQNGQEGVQKCLEHKPDLVLMDLIMPVMDGVEATRQIMIGSPCPILVVTSAIEHNVAKVFAALGAGALDAINTPVSGNGAGESTLFLNKIDQIGRLAGLTEPKIRTLPKNSKSKEVLVVIGASAGGPQALAAVLEKLPADFAAPVVVIQHIDEAFAKSLAGWLAEQVKIPVHVAIPGEPLRRGNIYLAGREEHLILSPRKLLCYTREPVNVHYKPSVDVFFESVAKQWTGPVLGVILTGMGADGARGLKKLRDLGNYTVAQNQETSAVYGMPKAAAEAGAVVDVLPLQEIPGALIAQLAKIQNN